MPKKYKVNFDYIVPVLRCQFCGVQIKQGQPLYTVIVKWGDGRSACKLCAMKAKHKGELQEKVK